MMNRTKLLAAEIFAYSCDNYASHLGIGHVRFETMMPDTARALQRAELENWTDEKLAGIIDVEVASVPDWRQRYRDAVEIIDAATPAAAFRTAVRQTIERELKSHNLGDAEVEALVKQICYRAADLSYLLRIAGASLSDYSAELRRED